MAMEEGNLNLMISAFLEMLETEGSIRKEFEGYGKENWAIKSDDDKKEIAFKLLERVEKNKGFFAQILASKLSASAETFYIPEYIKEAILWVCTGGANL